MMVISVCVNECVFYICYYLKAALVHRVSHIWWLLVHYKDTKQISVLQ